MLIVKYIHIVCGALALLAGLAAILLRRRVKIHKVFGKLYFWSMSIIFVSAVYLSFVKSNVFLMCVAFFSYYQCLVALRSLKLKKIHKEQLPSTLDWVIEGVFCFAHISFVIYAVYQLIIGNTQVGLVSFVFGATGLSANQSTIKRLNGRFTQTNYWLIAHVSGMLGSYIGAITAFTVNNNQRIGLPDILAWLGPTVILVPFIVYEVRKLKVRTISD